MNGRCSRSAACARRSTPGDGVVRAVDGIDFSVDRGEIMGLVGESGCGKSVTSLSIMRLVAQSGRIEGGEILFDGQDLLKLSPDAMRHIRGERISMIFQQPTLVAEPGVGRRDADRGGPAHPSRHEGQGRRGPGHRPAADGRHPRPEAAAEGLPARDVRRMAQRIMIAMALACEPELLIADEPTTALDVTIQAQILDLMRNLRDETGTAIILITHDLGVVAEMCDRVAVMYAGEIVEQTDVVSLFREPLHPYTRGLIGSIPVVGDLREELAVIPGNVPNLIDLPAGCRFAPRCLARIEEGIDNAFDEHPSLLPVRAGHDVRCWIYHDQAGALRPRPAVAAAAVVATRSPSGGAHDGERERGTLVEVRNLVKHFPVKGGVLQRTVAQVQAVDDVSFDIRRGETLGLVGESGCGKTTVGRLLLRLIDPTSGTIRFDGEDITRIKGADLKRYRRRMQIIFQDPYASLDPRTPIADSIGEGLRVHGLGDARERGRKVARMMDLVGLQTYHARRYPHEFSGGQRQRIGIARALVLEPDLVVCDEPVSALDVSIQAQVLNLLRTLQGELGLTYLFVAHNMGVVEHISDRVAVMYLGKIVEVADRREMFRNPEHPYSQALLSAIPVPNPELRRQRVILRGDVPSPVNPPTGCHFHPRCQLRQALGDPEICATHEPPLTALGDVAHGLEHDCACHFRGPGAAAAMEAAGIRPEERAAAG